MVQYCVMVKGPCRGKMCDFWARIKIRKASIEELVVGIRESIAQCNSTQSMILNDALREYWTRMGIRNFERLCEEEPDLCAKMIDAELQAQSV
ncbi:MAG: hypothetical protein JW779_07340 [Candidatus Thorarchaeota archaeon]|nr:hypothetical protein [Candidatus Thorarchaeota archaeon]